MSNMSYPVSRYGPVPRQRQRIRIDGILIALAAFIVATVADIMTTVQVLHTGAGKEADAPIAWMISQGGLWTLVLPLLLAVPIALFAYRYASARAYRVMAASIVVSLWVYATVHGIQSFHNMDTLRLIAASR